jgi:hypothetical protein
LREQIKITKADKKLVPAELMMVCQDRLRNAKLKPEEVKDFDVAGAICDHLEVLVTQEQLNKSAAYSLNLRRKIPRGIFCCGHLSIKKLLMQ